MTTYRETLKSELPIIIPAKDAADHLPKTLSTLHQIGSEVIVVINGTSDNSAEISLQAGATVLESKPGKMPAIQAGLEYLGSRALEPLVILDADTYPLDATGWARAAYDGLSQSYGAAAIYPWLITRSGSINGSLRTLRSLQNSLMHPHKPLSRVGHSMGLKLTQNSLKDFLSLPNFWPREDIAMVRVMQKDGVKTQRPYGLHYFLSTPCPNPEITLIKRLSLGLERASEISDDLYIRRGPSDAIYYNDKQFCAENGLPLTLNGTLAARQTSPVVQ